MLIENLKELLGEEKWEVVKRGDNRRMAVMLGFEDKMRRLCTYRKTGSIVMHENIFGRCVDEMVDGWHN